MKIAIITVSRNRPDLLEAQVAQLKQSCSLPHDLYVVECGTDADRLSPHATLWFADPDFRGKCYGHNVGLEAAKLAARYDYYFFLMNDVVFEAGVDPVRTLVEQMEREPRMAILSPTSEDGTYPGSARRGTHGWRAVTTCDYLGFLMRGDALEQVGFLNADFRYCWGAIHELAYKLYSHGWFVAYSDAVRYRHLGGSTYGQKNTATISREEYQQRAKRFAFDYFRRKYGDNWDELFWAATQGHEIAVDTFAEHKRLWASAYTPAELVEMGVAENPGRTLIERMVPNAAPNAVKLHLGCGPEKRSGWINVDTNPSLQPDVVAEVDRLPMFGERSVDVIEACHLFEHLTLPQARSALREWARILKPTGELFLELPNLDECIRILGRYRDSGGYDIGLIGLFGWPPAIEQEGLPQVHKWGWTRESLMQELREAGFDGIEFGPITQTWRVAAKLGRDMRVRAVRCGVPTASQNSDKVQANVAAQNPATTRAPIHLSTQARFKAFAWPDWNSNTEVEFLLNAYGRHMIGRNDACLCLRRDPKTDPSEAQVMSALQAAHARVLGPNSPIEILLIDNDLSLEDWRGLALQLQAVVELPSSRTAQRSAVFEPLASRKAATIGDFVTAMGGTSSPSQTNIYSREVLDRVDWPLVGRIKELHPWMYPVELGTLKVTAGVGTNQTPELIDARVEREAELLRLALGGSIELRGKRVLHADCGCAFWSARFAELGAVAVVGTDDEERHVRQAQLYWEAGRFLPPEQTHFLHTRDESSWRELDKLGPFDIVLWTPESDEIDMRRSSELAQLAKEAFIVLHSTSEDHAPFERLRHAWSTSDFECRVLGAGQQEPLGFALAAKRRARVSSFAD